MHAPGRTHLARTIIVATLALAGCGGQPAVTPGPSTAAATSATSLVGHPLVGSWTTSVTKEDLATGGITDPAARNENSGRFTWTFAVNGAWTAVQESLDSSPITNPVFRGTYTVDGATLVMTTEFPTAYKDAGLHYSWSIAGTAATFDLLDPPDPLLPLIVETHPWVRVP